MISTAKKCGCTMHFTPLCPESEESDSSDSNISCSNSEESDTECDENQPCICEDKAPSVPKSVPLSEIANNERPYKEIDICINDNRMVLRLQTEHPDKEYDPPCDCNSPQTPESKCPPQIQCSSNLNNKSGRGHDKSFQKSSEGGCRTINVYPHPDFKITDQNKHLVNMDKQGHNYGKGKKGPPVKLPTVNPDENPNIFVLKIKRKCENADKTRSLNLEFRTPRPMNPCS